MLNVRSTIRFDVSGTRAAALAVSLNSIYASSSTTTSGRSSRRSSVSAGIKLPSGLLGEQTNSSFAPVSRAAADLAACASLEDLPYLQANVQRLIAERTRLETELAKIPFLKPYPSRSNFVLCEVEGMSAADVRQRLAQEYGIVIRYYNKSRLRDCVRISAGKPEQTDALLAALRKI